jgi:hypothetical protein
MNKNIKLEDRGSFLLLRVKKHELQVREERPCELLALQSGPFTCSYSLSLSLSPPLSRPSSPLSVGSVAGSRRAPQSPRAPRCVRVCVRARVCVSHYSPHIDTPPYSPAD